eukprot:CAMPEP_0115044360 /NCGR_PEP_ID=MMETSP0216-20121206/47438_1 /TAXON_ID=223996 /ORGANISM="Protocruzia adherens, Strain Boccale" /LENGTH=118 /DNA_ID=CAMNT_0002426897 /DNA_START=573 /DNA_END=929 /DNA_ORIENTATION=+
MTIPEDWNITVSEVASILGEDATKGVLLDCRSVDMYESVRAIHAKNVPLSKLKEGVDDVKQIVGNDLNKPIYCICRSGNNSKLGTTILKEAGFADVKNVLGGTNAWVEANLPHEKKTK